MLCFNNNVFNNICYAVSSDEEVEEQLSDGIDGVLDDIDSSNLDEFLDYDLNFEFFNASSFLELVQSVLSGNYFDEYDSIFDWLKETCFDNAKSILSFLVMILAIILLNEMFKSFCSDKYSDVKKIVNLIFSFVVVLIIALMMKDVANLVSGVLTKIFNFIKILFPILLSLVLTSGASGTYSIYSSLSVFLLNTGSYVFIYVLMPLSLSILILSLVGSIFNNKRFSKTVDLFKTIFKYVIGVMFSVFGIFSAVNLISSGVKDGVSLKITKYALKNYIPILGGYISDGFDFVHACSVLVKNAFGICGIFVLLFMVLKPLIYYFVCLLAFKILSVIVSYIGVNYYSEMFDNVSKCMGYFISILVGVFLIMFVFIYLIIISVSVVWLCMILL